MSLLGMKWISYRRVSYITLFKTVSSLTLMYVHMDSFNKLLCSSLCIYPKNPQNCWQRCHHDIFAQWLALHGWVKTQISVFPLIHGANICLKSYFKVLNDQADLYSLFEGVFHRMLPLWLIELYMYKLLLL